MTVTAAGYRIHIARADWRETGRTCCGRTFASLPSDCGCGSPQCANVITPDGANPSAPAGICIPCWKGRS